MERSSFGCCFDYVLYNSEKELNWCHRVYMELLLYGFLLFFGLLLFSYFHNRTRISWEIIWYCFMVSFLSSKKQSEGLLACIPYLWFPKNHAPAGGRWRTEWLTTFPLYNPYASCVWGCRKGGTRTGLLQLHTDWKDIDSFHFLCVIWMQRRRTRQMKCPDTVSVWHFLNVWTAN